MRRVVFLAAWLIITFLSPITVSLNQSQAVADKEPTLKLASLSPVFQVALAQEADLLADSTTAALDTKSTYTLAAEQGDGITHLARKAIQEYLTDSGTTDAYERSQKVYLEDFLQNRVGTYWLEIGQTLKFTVSEIEEAIGAVQEVDTGLLEASLARFVANVNWDKYETLAFARASEGTDDSQVNEDQDDSATTDENTDDESDIEAARTENTDNNRQRTIIYIIVVVIILVIAGYLLFKGTNDDSDMPKMDEMKSKDANGTKTKKDSAKVLKEDEKAKIDYTKSDHDESK